MKKLTVGFVMASLGLVTAAFAISDVPHNPDSENVEPFDAEKWAYKSDHIWL